MFDSIWPYLTEVLLANTDNTTLTKREQQLAEHDAFIAHHITVYEGGQQYLEFLNNKLEQGRCHHLHCEVLIKPPGVRVQMLV